MMIVRPAACVNQQPPSRGNWRRLRNKKAGRSSENPGGAGPRVSTHLRPAVSTRLATWQAWTGAESQSRVVPGDGHLCGSSSQHVAWLRRTPYIGIEADGHGETCQLNEFASSTPVVTLLTQPAGVHELRNNILTRASLMAAAAGAACHLVELEPFTSRAPVRGSRNRYKRPLGVVK